MELENITAANGTEDGAFESDTGIGPEDYSVTDGDDDVDGGYGQEEPAGQGDAQPGEAGKEDVPGQQEPSYRVKFNHEERDVPVSELVALAQKGMNYDKVAASAQAVEQSPEMLVMRQAIAQSGMDAATFLEQWQNGLDAAAVQQQVEAGMTPEAATRFVAMERQANEWRAAERAAQEDARVRDGVMEFAAAYPDVKEFPPEVMELMERGVPPLYAYHSYENAQLRTRIQELETAAAAKEADRKNRTRAPGSAAGMADGEESDPFLAGMHEAMNNY